MNMQHTPAPWTLDPCASGWMLISNGQDITAKPFDARDADARLIAAAPDLLAALQMVNRIWSHDQTANLAPDSPAAIVRAAIARATGGAA